MAENRIVVHEQYGVGTIVRVSGRGGSRKVLIRFVDGGEKTFIADKVRLRTTDGEPVTEMPNEACEGEHLPDPPRPYRGKRTMTAKKPSYWEQLRDPRWQKVRLEVMQRDEWRCLDCDGKTGTLNVHHTYYERGLSPWEYPIESLRTLCEPCHEKAQEWMRVLQREIGLTGPEDSTEFLVGLVRGVRTWDGPWISVPVENEQVAAGIGRMWQIETSDVLALVKDGSVVSEDLSRCRLAAMNGKA